jgi:hypothetical protein
MAWAPPLKHRLRILFLRFYPPPDPAHSSARSKAVGGGRCLEIDTGGADVVGERRTQLIVLDLADERRARTESAGGNRLQEHLRYFPFFGVHRYGRLTIRLKLFDE